MATTASRPNVSTTAVRLDAATESDVHQGAADFAVRFGQHFMARNRHATLSLFVGGADVTASTGFEVLPSETFVADLGSGDGVYGITASGTVPVHVFQAGV